MLCRTAYQVVEIGILGQSAVIELPGDPVNCFLPTLNVTACYLSHEYVLQRKLQRRLKREWVLDEPDDKLFSRSVAHDDALWGDSLLPIIRDANFFLIS